MLLVYIKSREAETAEVISDKKVLYNGKEKVISDKKVLYNGEEMTYNEFARRVTGWSAIQIYAYLTIVGESETLLEKRHTKMKELHLI